MLGYVMAPERGAADRLLAEVAATLMAEGMALAGAVQWNSGELPARDCTMELSILHGGAARVCISQNLGAGSTGCRLDSAALEQAVARVEGVMEALRPDLLIVNKFGKAEVSGAGFRQIIGRALADGIPVLTGVNPRNIDGFHAFAEGMATALPPQAGAILDWCRTVHAGERAGAAKPAL